MQNPGIHFPENGYGNKKFCPCLSERFLCGIGQARPPLSGSFTETEKERPEWGLFLSDPGKSLWLIESFPVAAIVLFFRDSSDQNMMLFHIVFQWNPCFRMDDIVNEILRSCSGRLLFDYYFVGIRIVTV